MSIFYIGMSSLPLQQTSKILARTQLRSEVLKWFWISEVGPADRYERETADQHNFSVESVFLIRWNKEEGSEFIPFIPIILNEAFGSESLLVFDLNRELVGYEGPVAGAM